MLFQVFFAIISGPLVFANGSLPRCFDFENPVRKVLSRPERSTADHGMTGEKVAWAELTEKVNIPIKTTLELLLDHKTTSSSKVDEMTVDVRAKPGYITQHIVSFVIKPFPLIRVEWKELWAYEQLKGTSEEPEEVLISYEKIDGTRYIEYLCGSILLRRIGSGVTEVYQFERNRATSRTAKDTLDGLKGTIAKIKG